MYSPKVAEIIHANELGAPAVAAVVAPRCSTHLWYLLPAHSLWKSKATSCRPLVVCVKRAASSWNACARMPSLPWRLTKLTATTSFRQSEKGLNLLQGVGFCLAES